MPEPADNKIGVDDKNNPAPPKVEFSKEQQDLINSLFDTRFGKITSKHNDEKKALQDKIDELTKLLDAKGTDDKDNKDGKGKDKENLEKQFKALLDAEKQNSQRALDIARQKEEEVKATNAKLKDFEKSQAMREAAGSLETVEFVDWKLVKKYTEENIVWDDDANTWVVKENGQIRQNNSLQPMTLAEFYKEFASQHPYLVKGVTKGGAGSGEGAGRERAGIGKVTSKADLKTVKDKVAFIRDFGQEAYEKLPLRN